MNHCVNKWQQNKQKFIQGSLCGTERCDSWHLASYRYSSSLVCLPPSPALSPSPARSPTESGWPGTSSPTDSAPSYSQTGPKQRALLLNDLPWSHRHLIQMYSHLWKSPISKDEGWLLPVTVLITVKSSWVQQPNQLVGRDALLCLFHLATSAIILSLKRSLNNYNYLLVGI